MLTHIVTEQLDTEYKYNGSGLLISIGKPGDNQYYVINYDNSGIITDETIKTYNTDAKVTKTTLTKFVVKNGAVTQTNTYDDANILLSTADFTYDSNGNLATNQVTDAKTNVKTLITNIYGTHHSLFYNSLIKFYCYTGVIDLFNKNEYIKNKVDSAPPASTGFQQYLNHYYTFKNDYQLTFTFSTNGSRPTGTGGLSQDSHNYTYANL